MATLSRNQTYPKRFKATANLKVLWTFFAIVLLFLSTGVCKADSIEADSLEQALTTKLADSTRFEVLYKLAWRYRNISLSKGVERGNQALDFAKKAGNSDWQARANAILARLYRKSGEYELALDHALQGIADYKKNNNEVGIGGCYNTIGLINKNQGNYPLALDYFKRSLDVDRRLGTQEDVAVSLNNIGLAHYYQGEYDLALDSYLEALKIREESGNMNGAAGSFLNTGLIYHERQELDLAASYYQQAATIFENLNEIGNAAVCYNNLGILFFETDEPEKALEYYRKSLHIKKKLGSKSGIAGTYNNLGDMFRDLGHLDSARFYMEQSLIIREEIGDKSGIATVSNSLGRMFFSESNFARALPYLKKSLELGQELGSPEIVFTSAEYLAKLYEAQNQYREAYQYQLLAQEMNDSLDNESRVLEIARIEMQYQLEKKLRERDLLEAQSKALVEKKQDQQEAVIGQLTFALAFIGVIAVAGIVILFLRRRFRIRSKEQEERLGKIVELADDIIYRADPRGYFIYVNPSSVSLTGYKAEELIGLHFSELVVPKQRKEVVEYYKKHFLANTEPEYFEFAIHSKTGKEIWLGQKVQVARIGKRIVEFTSVARDITVWREAKIALKKSELKYRNLVDTMNEGLLMANNEDRIVFANRRFCEMVGFNTNELDKLHASDLLVVTEEERKRISKQHLYREIGEQDGYEVQFQNKKGEYFWVWVSSSTMVDDNGNPTGSIGVITDISVIKEAERALLEAKELAELSTKAKEQFLANMSHEIRTPINGIMGMSHLLSESGLKPQQSEYLQSVQFASEHLLRIVNDVLDFSKIEAGRVVFESVPFLLKDQLEQTLGPLRIRAREKNIGLELHLEDGIENKLVGDPFRLRQVIFNLVNNAIKFTEQGKVELRVITESEASPGNVIGDLRLRFEVKDTGIGISEDQQEHIFGNFTQANSDTTRKYGGTGLGLAIARQLVEQQGGDLWLKSHRGNGSSFFFSLGFFLAPADAWFDKRLHAEDRATANLEGLKVLVAEDNPTGQLFLNRLLESWGCEARMVVNGQEVLDALEEEEFQVLILDVQMPVMDGYTTARKIRSVFKGPVSSIPILALTAHALPGEAEKCKEAGMDDYLSKPFPPATLHHLLTRLSEKHIAKQLEYQPLPSLPVSEQEEPDLSYLYEAAAGDPDFMTDIIDSFLDRNKTDLEQLELTIQSGKHTFIRKAAHYIAPTYEYVGCLSCYTLAESIENLAEKDAPIERIKERFRQLRNSSEESREKLKLKKMELRNQDPTEKISPQGKQV